MDNTAIMHVLKGRGNLTEDFLSPCSVPHALLTVSVWIEQQITQVASCTTLQYKIYFIYAFKNLM